MTALIPFDFRGSKVRVVTLDDGQSAFVAGDVCYILGYSNPRDAVAKHVRVHQRGTSRIATPSGDQDVTVITEPGLYRLMMRARTALADEFQDWVTDEVLPAIRKTGRYEVDVPRSLPEALRAYATEVEAHEQTRAELTIVKPQAEAWNVLADTGADYSVRDASYILNRDPAINTGQVRLFALLRSWRLIGPGNKPYANHSKHVTLRPQTRRSPMGERIPAAPQVRVTVEGLAYLHKRMGGTEPLDVTPQDGAA